MTTESGIAQQPTLEMGMVSVEEKPVDDYLSAVGDELSIYRETGLAPPLYGTAASLGLLLRNLELPPGAIHSLQEFSVLAPITLGQELQATAALERPRQRGNLQFITAATHLKTSEGDVALSGKTTVLVSDGATAAADRSPRNADGATSSDSSQLPVVQRTISREQLIAYSTASGDDNPLHLEEAFAAGTRFGGIIAHGMLTLAFLSEMLTLELGERWLTSGSLRARFKGAAYIGDRVETWGRIEESTGDPVTCTVGVRNAATGEDLITGTATAK